jgi:hypothetical protein
MAHTKPAGAYLPIKFGNLHVSKDDKGIKLAVRLNVRELTKLRQFIDRVIGKP